MKPSHFIVFIVATLLNRLDGMDNAKALARLEAMQEKLNNLQDDVAEFSDILKNTNKKNDEQPAKRYTTSPSPVKKIEQLCRKNPGTVIALSSAALIGIGIWYYQGDNKFSKKPIMDD